MIAKKKGRANQKLETNQTNIQSLFAQAPFSFAAYLKKYYYPKSSYNKLVTINSNVIIFLTDHVVLCKKDEKKITLSQSYVLYSNQQEPRNSNHRENLSPKAFYCPLSIFPIVLYTLIERIRASNRRMAEMGKEKSYCNPTRVYLQGRFLRMLGISSDMRGNTRRYFPGDACRGHVRIKSFRVARRTCTYVRYARVMCQRTRVSTRSISSRAAARNSGDRRAGISKQSTFRSKSIRSRLMTSASYKPASVADITSRNGDSLRETYAIYPSAKRESRTNMSSLIR